MPYDESTFTRLKQRLRELAVAEELSGSGHDALFINQARQYIQRKTKFRAQITSREVLSPTITASYQGLVKLTRPTGYRSFINLVQTSPVYFGNIAYMTLTQANCFYSRPIDMDDEIFEAIVEDKDQLILYPPVIATIAVVAGYFHFNLDYGVLLDALSDSNTTDYFSETAFDLIVQMALVYYFIFDREYEIAKSMFEVVDRMIKDYSASEYGDIIHGNILDLGELQAQVAKFGIVTKSAGGIE